ncbi:hypothetical protein SAMN05445850_0759 [Paraburkholderia tuberum]|uniref:Uncharacterized protein n=1 Tax=Paraburkholderia tuberum TaxID=157910 RepID=A0A1H1B7U4_9BURK|nr:hypothetical protein [Paraburkholderia tuberum]SDQ47989.1 hypothetical protein SAMN05445850_0759 [Paraburkholderia tuberum]
MTESIHAYIPCTVLDCVHKQVDQQLADAGAVSLAGSLARHAHVDPCIRIRSAYLICRIVADTPDVPRREVHWKRVTQAGMREDEKIVNHPLHAHGAALRDRH